MGSSLTQSYLWKNGSAEQEPKVVVVVVVVAIVVVVVVVVVVVAAAAPEKILPLRVFQPSNGGCRKSKGSFSFLTEKTASLLYKMDFKSKE